MTRAPETDTSFDGAFGEVTGKISYLFSNAQQTLTGTTGLSYSW